MTLWSGGSSYDTCEVSQYQYYSAVQNRKHETHLECQISRSRIQSLREHGVSRRRSTTRPIMSSLFPGCSLPENFTSRYKAPEGRSGVARKTSYMRLRLSSVPSVGACGNKSTSFPIM